MWKNKNYKSTHELARILLAEPDEPCRETSRSVHCDEGLDMIDKAMNVDFKISIGFRKSNVAIEQQPRLADVSRKLLEESKYNWEDVVVAKELRAVNEQSALFGDMTKAQHPCATCGRPMYEKLCQGTTVLAHYPEDGKYCESVVAERVKKFHEDLVRKHKP